MFRAFLGSVLAFCVSRFTVSRFSRFVVLPFYRFTVLGFAFYRFAVLTVLPFWHYINGIAFRVSRFTVLALRESIRRFGKSVLRFGGRAKALPADPLHDPELRTSGQR
jgi:hypothetical protein